MSDESTYIPRDNRRIRNRAFFGILLIVLGAIFLLRQFTSFDFRNWWAIFILIPAFGSFSSAWMIYRHSGRFNEGVRSSIGGGLIVLTVALIFFFDLDWSTWWPLMLLVPGFVLFISGFTLPGSKELQRPLAQRLYRPWLGWTGLGVMLLGAGFLANLLGIYDPALLFPNWWALAILIPAAGGGLTALRLLVGGAGLGWAAMSNLLTTAIFAVVGLVAFFGIGWNLLTPIIIIAMGLILLVGVFRR
jgi:hypothetical protein